MAQPREKRTSAMPKWKAWLILSALGSVGGLLLWFGLAIVVTCRPVSGGRVDVTVERRFLGWVPVSSETVPDVVKAEIGAVWARTSGGGKQRRGSSVRLELIPRVGPVCVRAQFGPSFGTRPAAMAERIHRFLQEPADSPLTTWWMPWLVNLAALPFVLVPCATLGEVLWHALGSFKARRVSG